MDMSDEDDCDFEIIPKRAFDIGVLPENMDITSPPTSGLEYLRQVKYELLHCPEVVTADIDPKQFIHKQTVKIDDCNGLVPAPPGFAPTAEWQKKQVSAFYKLRVQLFSKKPEFQKRSSKDPLPKIQDMREWRTLCLGKKMYVKPSDNELQDSNEVDVSKSKNCVSLSEGQLPLLSILVRLIQPDVEKLLAYHIQWINEYGFSHHQGCWLYALLTCLEKPLTPNACDLLRSLSRTCANLRSELESKEDEFLTPLNLLICLVANYFDQKDMRDTDESNTEEVEEENEDEDEQ